MLQTVVAHAPFIAAALLLATFGQFFKGTVFTKHNVSGAKSSLVRRLLIWGRKSMPIHPVIIGVMIGHIPNMPLSEGMEHSMIISIMYYGSAGVVSTWVYDVIKNALKRFNHEEA